jgi:tetratricopeptide (TPR) repeat protein
VAQVFVLLKSDDSGFRQPEDWRTWIGLGNQRYKAGLYLDAADAFQNAVDLHSDDPVPHLYLGLACNQQYVPGGSDPSNIELAIRAEQAFRRAVDLDGENWPALVLLGRFTWNEGRFDEARAWFGKALHLDPSNANIWCTLGAIAWRDFRANYIVVPDCAPRQFKAGSDLVIAEGISNSERALDLDPLNDRAMAFLDTLIRERADLRSTPEESLEDIALADEWRRK